MLEHGLAAGGAEVLGGNVPCNKAAVRAAFAGVEHIALLRGALEDPAAALGAFAGHLDDDGLCKGTLREAGAGEEVPEAALFHNHLAAADVAVFIAENIRNLELHAVHSLFGLIHLPAEVPVEIGEDVAPLCLAVLDAVKLLLHLVCELQVDDIGKVLFHKPGDNSAERRGLEVLALFYNIVMGSDGGYSRRVGGRAAYALFLHGADERGLGEPCGRLGELLLGDELFERQRLTLAQARQGICKLAALLVLRLLVHGGEALKLHFRIGRAEGVARGGNFDGDVIILCVCHLAGGEASPDKAVEPVLLLRQILAHKLRREVHVRRADGLMRVLRAGLGLEMPGRAGVILGAVVPDDEVLRGSERFLGKAEGVGTHIGDKADAAVPAYLNALVELLGDGHRAARGHAQAARGLLLKS